MRFLLFLAVCYFCIIIFKGRKFRTPYTLTMIFGKKGSGKTTYLVQQGLKYQKRGYHVYTNIDSVRCPGFLAFDPRMLGSHVPPQKSVILLDEAGIVYDNRNFSKFTAETRDFFKLQRHYRCVVFLASQSYDVDKKLRDLTDRMILVQSFLPGLSLCRPIRRKIVLTESTSMGESRIADNLKFCSVLSWRLLRISRYTRYFDSFTAPTRPELVGVQIDYEGG